MSLPLNILDLTIDDDREDGAADKKKRLEKGAETVEDFARSSGLAALDAALDLAAGNDLEAAVKAGEVATEVTQQTTMLEAEVERFLATAPKN